jgi:zinc and cadmium transporter
MSTIAWIAVASLTGAALSVVCAALFALTAHAKWVPILVSYAVGALLGAAFLEMLPHAFSQGKSAELVAASILAGILLFFILEKLVLWRHFHADEFDGGHAHGGDDHGRSGLMILVGNTIHNFVDGILIAAAFMADTQLAYFALHAMTEWIPVMLGIAAASMIYVAVADLIPGLHRRAELRATVSQVLLISAGVASIALMRVFVEH